MTTLPRLLLLVCGIVLFMGPATAQDLGRRGAEAPPTFPQARRGGPGRGLIEPPRPLSAPIPGWAQEPFQRSVELGPRGNFEVRNLYGEVRITGTEGNTIRINAMRRVREPNKEAARALLQNVVVRVTERGGGVEVFTENPTTTVGILVDYEIAVPTAANVSIRNSGTIRVANIKGELRAEAIFGNMQLNNVARVRQAKTYSGGNVLITGAEGEEIIAETSLSGVMQLRDVRARTIELNTINGSISANVVDCQRCSFKTFGGDIEFSGTLRPNARYVMESTKGNIRMVPEGNVGFDLDAISNNTRIEFPLKPTAAPSPDATGRIHRGSYGDGSAIISLSTFFGNVVVARPPVSPR